MPDGLGALHSKQQDGGRHADSGAKDEHGDGDEAADGGDEPGMPAVKVKLLRRTRVLKPAGAESSVVAWFMQRFSRA